MSKQEIVNRIRLLADRVEANKAENSRMEREIYALYEELRPQVTGELLEEQS